MPISWKISWKSFNCAALACLGLVGPGESSANFVVERIADGLSRPLYVTTPPGDYQRLFIVEQHSGQIKILRLADSTILATPFLTVPGLSTGGEQGLLGLAFDPDYASNGRFYVNYTDAGGTTVVARYRVSVGDANIADPSSAEVVITYAQPFANHNGGWLGFGPDEMLYIASGDGGSANDPGNRAQDITDQPLGKILRIDVGGDDFPADPLRNYAIAPDNPFVGEIGDDEIWAYGLRNPWRPGFDRLTGDLYIADVGQNAREEVNFQPAASTGGENYGWRLREGTIATPAAGVGGPAPPGAIDPIYDYTRGTGTNQGFSVTGGYVYRGPVAALQGRYFFADFVNARIWSIRHDGSATTEFIDWTAAFAPDAGAINNIASFGEDAQGNLYVVDLGGEVFRIVTAPELDADGDFVPDTADNCRAIANADQRDSNADGFGNRCDPDLNGDLQVNTSDLAAFKARFFGTDADADLDGDGQVNFQDLVILKQFFFGAPGPSGIVP